MQTIQHLIVEKLPEYSNNQKKIANFILENMKTVPLLSVNQIADKVGVSSASVVRFSRLLGFTGYLEFRNKLMEILKEHLSPLEQYKKTLTQKDTYKNSLEKVAQKTVDKIHHTLEQNSLDVFKHIIQHIRNADNIFCLGMGISQYLAQMMAYLLKLYIKKAFALSSDSPSFPEQIVLMEKKDLLFVFSFPPPPTADKPWKPQNRPKNMNIPVISFTDKKTALSAQ
ncbi:MAG: SIS domain-containing protein [Caldithrix sp.]|nr:SIS domain-containing protein [Caldithrix sp.]